MTKVIKKFLPIFDERKCDKIDMLVIHCSAYNSDDMIKIMKERNVSSHYIIEENGSIFQLVSEKKRAWHAGISNWRGLDSLNHYSIGIELQASSMGQGEYSVKQINSLLVLSKQIISHYQIPLYNVVGHSDIAPRRKPDPGSAFPWKYMAQKGVGLWYDLADAVKVKENNIENLLNLIGYDTSDLSAASYAFCRHFIPQEVKPLNSVDEVIENVYPPEFALAEKYTPILKACAYRYSKSSNRHG
ncbi:MAG: N-acetylmuramoyl-L-alanine amidase [Alphaproteobacteria bacterium]|nr:N-acetylmuramoyl-L-alanine amidase [Alphaproteobacteria bacterium]